MYDRGKRRGECYSTRGFARIGGSARATKISPEILCMRSKVRGQALVGTFRAAGFYVFFAGMRDQPSTVYRRINKCFLHFGILHNK